MRIQYTFDGQSGTLDVTDTTEVNAANPLIILLHGMGGNEDHMVNPALNPGENYDHSAPFPADRDVGWHDYPGVGVWSLELDPMKSVTGWGPFLNSHRYRTASYSQVDPTGLLAQPVRELRAVVQALMKNFPDPKIRFVVIAHGKRCQRSEQRDFGPGGNRGMARHHGPGMAQGPHQLARLSRARNGQPFPNRSGEWRDSAARRAVLLVRRQSSHAHPPAELGLYSRECLPAVALASVPPLDHGNGDSVCLSGLG